MRLWENLTDRKKGLIAACTTAGTWSLLAIFLKIALQHSDSYSIVWYRMTISAVVLFGWLLIRGQGKQLNIFLSRPGQPLIAALCLGFNYVGFMQGIHYASPATAQILIQLGPLLLALSGIFIFKEKLSKRQKLGLLACVVGFSIFFADRIGNPGRTETVYLGIAWVVSAAVIWAIFASLLKFVLLRWRSTQTNLYIYTVVALIYLPMVDWQSLAAASWFAHGLFIFLGLNTIMAYGSLSVALNYLPATQVSPILTMNPLVTLVIIALMDHWQLGIIPLDPIGWSGYLGAIIAVFGIRFVLQKANKPKVQ